MSAVMQGYELERAVPFIAAAMRKYGIRAGQDELAAFIRRAVEADMRYMHETGVLTQDGLMGEGEYDEDDAFEALLSALAGEAADETELNRTTQMLDAYMEGQSAFLENSGLCG
ncbi:MAG: hypothetical protein Q4G52_11600 [Clostridia bacterium]|nr:hypothetical protein [Clostridia bacterium]